MLAPKLPESLVPWVRAFLAFRTPVRFSEIVYLIRGEVADASNAFPAELTQRVG